MVIDRELGHPMGPVNSTPNRYNIWPFYLVCNFLLLNISWTCKLRPLQAFGPISFLDWFVIKTCKILDLLTYRALDHRTKFFDSVMGFKYTVIKYDHTPISLQWLNKLGNYYKSVDSCKIILTLQKDQKKYISNKNSSAELK